MLFERIFKELEKRKIKYLVVGGVAVNLHGYPRLTGDLDILLLFEDANLKKYVKMIKELGLKPRVPVTIEDFMNLDKRTSWIRDKGMKVFSVFDPKNIMETIDVLMDSELDFKKAYKRQKKVLVGKFSVHVVSIDDLIYLKEKAGRGRDQIDVGALKKLKEMENE